MKSKSDPIPRPEKFQGRPFFIKIVVILILACSILNFIRGGVAIHYWDYYQVYAAAPLPLYLSISGFVWGVTFLSTGVLLWLRWTVAIYLTGGLSILAVVVFWLERSFLQVDPSRWKNLVFIILIQSLLLIFIFASLWYVYPPRERTENKYE